MASPKAQKEDKAKNVQADAAAAKSVPALRDQVVKLAEAVELLNEQVRELRERSI